MSPKFPAVTSDEIIAVLKKQVSNSNVSQEAAMLSIKGARVAPFASKAAGATPSARRSSLNSYGLMPMGIHYRVSDGRRTVVPIHAGKIVKRKTFKSILADSGLTIEEFIELNR